MEFLKLAAERYSARKFKAQPVEQEKIDQLLRAAQLAPSGRNNQVLADLCAAERRSAGCDGRMHALPL